MYQRVIVVGHLGTDPEMRYTPSGQPVTNFSVATNRRWTDQEGNPQEETTWFRVVAWGKLAELCNQYLKKGLMVLVDGQIRTRSWEDQQGQTRYGWALHARNVRFLTPRAERVAEIGEPGEEIPPPEEDIPF